ncbi:hypothetical protein CPT_Sansa100 [Caulobacter phage Sansa]|uniref:Uncharacterized protein n=1 Tax=Caulobacter phage Sansa TaxID=1675600 RepID=A0A0K1LM22_9CAUD|nr:hypothetical protein HOR07_gp100 [Caulobacter phage Sansa]AKU43504.1 hypothetical protein CPT_Sansa100 [Caulobacter phage Sansa]
MGELAVLGFLLIAVFFFTYLVQGVILLLQLAIWILRAAVGLLAWVACLIINPRATLEGTFAHHARPAPLDWSNIDLDA